ncbi:hypothetical protein, partial [Klebsiella pneumoniae]|uniref:hypothetical protein n=1 Tax=Klebsiella pneumoniae TaxID=573 RepID=UPI0030131B42
GQVIDTVELTSVERAVVQGRHLHRATDWLAEHTEALAAITRVANIARANWQPPAAGTTTGGVTIGARTTISCTHCGDRITSDDPGKGLAGD